MCSHTNQIETTTYGEAATGIRTFVCLVCGERIEGPTEGDEVWPPL